MTVAEQTFETYVDDGSELAKVVMAAKEAHERGEKGTVLVVDLTHKDNADYDASPLLDSLMTLGFSRSWTAAEDAEVGILSVNW